MNELIVKTSFVELMEKLGDAERGRLFTAMLHYARTGEELDLRGNELYLFPAARMMIDAQRNEIDLTCDVREKERTKERERARDIDNTNLNLSATSRNSRKSFTYPEDFECFWNVYPRKIDKQKAYLSWKKINPSDGLAQYIVNSVEEWCKCDQWQDERFIPHPTVFLNNARWESKPPKAKNKPGHFAMERDRINNDDFNKLVVNFEEEDNGTDQKE